MNKPKQIFSIFTTIFLVCFSCYLILRPRFKLSTRLQQIVPTPEESLPKTPSEFEEHMEKSNILYRTSNCDSYFSRLFSVIYNYEKQINVSDLLQSFVNGTPKVAVSYVIHDQPELFEILFHLTFKPFNSYCIYMDPKSTKEFQNLIFHILNCYQTNFPNTKIIIPQLRVPINWGGYSLFQADLQCLEDLYFSSG